MERSESITELSAALVAAQAALPAVEKRGRNPLLKNDYATFDDIVAVVKSTLNAHDLAVSQMLTGDGSGGTALETVIIHKSGQWIGSTFPFDAIGTNRGTNEMQALGSSITYAKRYALAAMVGLASDEDDDGNAAKRAPQRRPQSRSTKQAPQRATTKQGNGTHWIKDEGGRKSFWAWTNSKGLTNEQVHEALGVEHVEEFTGSKADAANAIEDWMRERPFTE